MNADGTDIQRLAGTEGGAYPDWSPDGQALVFYKELPGNDEIFLVSLATGMLLNLTHHPAGDFGPDWSPDGQQIVFESFRDGNYELYRINLDGSELLRLTNNQIEDQHPRWSPDGRSILFSRHGVLYLMDADGSAQRPFQVHPQVTSVFGAWRPCAPVP